MIELYIQLIGLGIQTLLLLSGGLMLFGGMKTEIRNQAAHLSSIDRDIEELRKAVVALARQEERIMSMDQRVSLQGQRLDRTIQKVDGFLIYGRRPAPQVTEEND